jgi:hypothetical protein
MTVTASSKTAASVLVGRAAAWLVGIVVPDPF